MRRSICGQQTLVQLLNKQKKQSYFGIELQPWHRELCHLEGRMNSMKFQQTLETNITQSVRNLTQLRTDTGLPRGWRFPTVPWAKHHWNSVDKPQESSMSKTTPEANGKVRECKRCYYYLSHEVGCFISNFKCFGYQLRSHVFNFHVILIIHVFNMSTKMKMLFQSNTSSLTAAYVSGFMVTKWLFDSEVWSGRFWLNDRISCLLAVKCGKNVCV